MEEKEAEISKEFYSTQKSAIRNFILDIFQTDMGYNRKP